MANTKKLDSGDLCMANKVPDCHRLTSWWWHKGTIPICPQCSPWLSNGEAYDLAKAEGFGPLPATRPED